ncbi:MAG: hypothetical protein WCG50_12830 [Rhodoferax sp.]|uniref:hypothetical protein n=1 Tax=Rhodoferax sp. TaxID=50421 RepID=UPI003019D452
MNERFDFWLRSGLVSALCWVAQPSQAQSPLDGRLLGLSESTLQSSFPALHRESKPLQGPHGVRGLWTLANTQAFGLPVDTTFFLKNKLIHRIEQRWTATATPCNPTSAFTKLVSNISLTYGAGVTSTDSTGAEKSQRSVVWVSGGVDVLAYLTQSPSQCTMSIVYKPHLEEDASTL